MPGTFLSLMSGAALAASPVGMAAGVALPLSVAAALMGSVPLVVVAAHCIRVIGQSACQQVGHRLVRRPRYAGIELDLRLGQGCSGPAADAAADQRLDARSRRNPASAPWPLPAVSTTWLAVTAPSSTS